MSEAVPRRGLLIGVLFVGLLGGVAASQPTVAKAPPEPVCGVCTDALDEAAGERGVALEREESRTDIRLHANGSAEFVALAVFANLWPLALWAGFGFSPWVLLAWLTLPEAVAVVRAVLRYDTTERLCSHTTRTSRLAALHALLLAIGIGMDAPA